MVKSNDGMIRVFCFRTGKIIYEINESVAMYENAQKDDNSLYRVDPIEFGRLMAVERDLEREIVSYNITFSMKNILFHGEIELTSSNFPNMLIIFEIPIIFSKSI